MKRYVLFFTVAGLSLGLTSCFQNCRAMDNGPVVTSQRKVSQFEKIETFHFSRNCGNVEIFITSPDVTNLVLRGSGTLTVKGKIDSDTLNLHLLGSGDMIVPDIICDRLITYLQGSGDLTVKKAQAVISQVKLLGSGDLNVGQQNVRNTNISLTGSGDINMRMTGCKTVSCKLIGSGDIKLTGNVATLNQSVTGSGDIDISNLKVGR